MPELPVYAPLGKPFTELDTVDSTNNYALSKAYAGLTQHGEVFFTRDQLAGKGQRGKSWRSTPGESMLMSMVIEPSIPVYHQFYLSAVIAVAVCETVSEWVGGDARIKWPNDIYWQDRKAGGILIENIIRASTDDAQWRYAIAGIGINLNQQVFPESLPNAISLHQITGKEYDPAALARELNLVIDETYAEWCQLGPERIFRVYNEKLYMRDQAYIFRQGSRKFEAHVRGVGRDGKLRLEHSIIEEFGYGELEWIGPKNLSP